MDKDLTLMIFNFSVGLAVLPAALVGSYKYRKVSEKYHPLIWIWWLIVANEILRFVLLMNKINSFASYNVFLLIQTLLFIYQFYAWKIISRRLAQFLGTIVVVAWVVDHFFWDGIIIHTRTLRYRLLNSSVLVTLGLIGINALISQAPKKLYKNPIFLTTLVLTIYYSYRILIDAFILKAVNSETLQMVSNFNSYLVLICYTIYLFAALCIPRKKTYLLPS